MKPLRVKKEKLKQYNLRLPPALMVKVNKLRAAQGLTWTNLFISLLERYVREREKAAENARLDAKALKRLDEEVAAKLNQALKLQEKANDKAFAVVGGVKRV